jgi:MoxR-like ATPase
VDETVEDYIVRLVQTTRQHSDLALGASPRGSLALFKTSQALAAVRGRDYVLPDDVKTMAPLVLTHRLLLKPESALRGRTAAQIVRDILESVELTLS